MSSSLAIFYSNDYLCIVLLQIRSFSREGLPPDPRVNRDFDLAMVHCVHGISNDYAHVMPPSRLQYTYLLPAGAKHEAFEVPQE